MKAMDNTKAIEAMEKMSLQKYLEKLIHAPMHKVTLFPVFSQTGAPNLSTPVYFVIIDDLSKYVGLNDGAYMN